MGGGGGVYLTDVANVNGGAEPPHNLRGMEQQANVRLHMANQSTNHLLFPLGHSYSVFK